MGDQIIRIFNSGFYSKIAYHFFTAATKTVMRKQPNNEFYAEFGAKRWFDEEFPRHQYVEGVTDSVVKINNDGELVLQGYSYIRGVGNGSFEAESFISLLEYFFTMLKIDRSRNAHAPGSSLTYNERAKCKLVEELLKKNEATKNMTIFDLFDIIKKHLRHERIEDQAIADVIIGMPFDPFKQVLFEDKVTVLHDYFIDSAKYNVGYYKSYYIKNAVDMMKEIVDFLDD